MKYLQECWAAGVKGFIGLVLVGVVAGIGAFVCFLITCIVLLAMGAMPMNHDLNIDTPMAHFIMVLGTICCFIGGLIGTLLGYSFGSDETTMMTGPK